MVDSGVLYNSDACFMISSVESPSRIFEKKVSTGGIDPLYIRDAATGGAGGHQEIFIADFRKNYAGNNGIFHNKSPFLRTILRL